MRVLFAGLVGLAVIVVAACSAEAPTPAALEPSTESVIAGYRGWEKAFEPRIQMADEVAKACVPVSQVHAAEPHGPKWIWVYANPIGAGPLQQDEGRYFPPGSVIVKEKYSSETGGEPELLTVMVQREKGYDDQIGDWEFLTFDGKGKPLRADKTGCISCHSRLGSHDYVFTPSVFLESQLR